MIKELIVFVLATSLAWQLRTPVQPLVLGHPTRATFQEQAAIQAERLPERPPVRGALESELRAIDDQLGQASLDQFKREAEIEKLDEQDRQNLERQAWIEFELDSETQQLREFTRQRDTAAQSGLQERSRGDVLQQVRRLEQERVVQDLERALIEQNRTLELLSSKLRVLVDQNYDSEELRRTRLEVAQAQESRDRTSSELELARLQLRLNEQSGIEAHDWNEAQARSDIIQLYDEQKRILRQKYAALQEELAALQPELDQRRQKRAALEEEWRASQQRIESLVEARNQVFQKLQSEFQASPRTTPPS